MLRNFLTTLFISGAISLVLNQPATAKCSVHSADALISSRYLKCKPKSLVSYLYNNIVTPYSFSCAKKIVTTCTNENCENPVTPEDRARCEEEYVAVLNTCSREIDYAATMASCKDTKFWNVAQDDGTQARVAVMANDLAPTVVAINTVSPATAAPKTVVVLKSVTAKRMAAETAIAPPLKLPRPGEALPSTKLAMISPRIVMPPQIGQNSLKSSGEVVNHPVAQTTMVFEKELPMTTITLASQNPHEPSQTFITFRPRNLVQPLETQAAARRSGGYGGGRITAADDDVAIVRSPRSAPATTRAR